MTNYQSNFNLLVAFKAQSALGTPATGSGATVLRVAGGPRGKLTKTAIESKEVRQDAQRTRGRHGFQQTSGSYDVEVSIGAFDDILQATLRGTWDAQITKTSSDFTNIAISGNVLTLGSGSPISMGFRVGDVFEMTGGAVAGNNSRNLRVGALSSTAITSVDLLTDHTTDTGITLIRRGRKVVMPAAGGLVRTYFTIEEYDVDLDQSTVYSDCYFNSVKFAMAPNGMLMATLSWIGTGDITAETTGGSPYFTSPMTPAGVPMSVKDAVVRFGSNDLADLTSFDLTIDNGAVAPQVVGAVKSPTVLPGQNSVSMNLGVLRTDLTNLSNYIAETGLSLHMLAVDTSSEPKNFLSINVPFFTLGGVDPSAPSTAGGAATETLAIPAALVGQDTNGSGYDPTMLSFQISNNS